MKLLYHSPPNSNIIESSLVKAYNYATDLRAN